MGADRTALYRHFDAEGRLLYVGISLSAVQRLAQHKQTSAWFAQIARVEVEWLPSRTTAEQAEREAIRAERPIHNTVHNCDAGRRQAPASRRCVVRNLSAVELPPVLPDQWASNEVLCAGDALGRMLWRGVQWAVTEHGVECRDGSYFICRSRLYEGHYGSDEEGWELHMERKGWVDQADFRRCMQIARELFPRGTRPADVLQPSPQDTSHPLVGRYFHSFEHGSIKWQGVVVAVDQAFARVDLFSWFLGERTESRLLPLEQLCSQEFKLYPSRAAWLKAAEERE